MPEDVMTFRCSCSKSYLGARSNPHTYWYEMLESHILEFSAILTAPAAVHERFFIVNFFFSLLFYFIYFSFLPSFKDTFSLTALQLSHLKLCIRQAPDKQNMPHLCTPWQYPI